MPSVLGCWLGGRKGIRPVKTEWWNVGMVIWDEVQTCIRPSRCHCHSLSLAPGNPDWFYLPGFLPFWYLLTRVVLDKFQNSSKTIVYVCVCDMSILHIGTRCTGSPMYTGPALIYLKKATCPVTSTEPWHNLCSASSVDVIVPTASDMSLNIV